MKKTYIAPEAVEYKVNSQHMIAESLPLSGTKLGAGSSLVKGQEEDLEMEDGDNTVSIWDLY